MQQKKWSKMKKCSTKRRRTKEGEKMKKRILIIVSLIILVVCSTTMLFACSSSDKFEGSDYEKMEKFYTDAAKDVKKCEETLDALVRTIKASSFSASYRSDRTYYSTADNNIAFKGDQENGGYNNKEKENGTKWMVDVVDYTILYKNGDYKITAAVYEPIASDDYNAKAKRDAKDTYTYMKKGEEITVLPADAEESAKCYCIDKMYDVIFGQFTNDAFLENYCTSANKGFRFVTHMMQYQMVRAFKYAADGTIDTASVINYTENKDKILFNVLEEVYADNTLSFKYQGEPKNITDDDVSYWAAYNEDIEYNLYKTAAIYNDRVTMTYKNKTKQLKTYEYFGERVLPFYTQKSDFKTYKVLKAVVADYTHFVVEFKYEDVTIA